MEQAPWGVARFKTLEGCIRLVSRLSQLAGVWEVCSLGSLYHRLVVIIKWRRAPPVAVWFPWDQTRT